MKKIFFVFVVFFLTACGQQNKETMKPQKDIYSIGSEIKHFDSEPQYGAYISTNDCSFDILINDIPIIKYKDNSGGGLSRSYFPLNWDITKKELQKITVRLSPGFNKETNSLYSSLNRNSGVQISIVESFKNKDDSWGDEEEIKNYTTPQKIIEGKEVASYNGNVSFEDSFTFKANVPYEINTLENAEILYTKDKDKLKQLEKEVVSKYNQIRNIYLKGSKDDLANVLYTREKRFAQQLYLSSEKIKSRWDDDYQFRTDSNLEFFDLKPIENYKMSFYGNGKLVCLEKINNEKSSLWGGFKKKGDDEITTTYLVLYLYRPKGSTKLEIY
ncbi:hypothetical protein [Chryseobacterium rhizosphaerae]|uniref:Uncharacterized protein n=1 Tax=Chryseobacterium rhizosphaerae TaxID=395937 RepID=A0ABX9IET9_9FLAO|nr:hypothetical protein [Chryseobacterium rhizosphaerae]REC71154.1 hypothetical protein DRF57_21050 [Chryseobacterium rhizosphaerae]GEN67616.1 hypothetical protein CRH01_21840 [Chryseobacterium rhizosphaerae]